MDEHASSFYLEYSPRLFTYLLYRCGDREVARDVAQESFVRYFEHYGDATPASPALLFTIARNALVDVLRYRDKFRVVEVVPASRAPAEDDRLLAQERSMAVMQAMRQLTELDREVLVLAVGGMAYRDIAATLGMSLANVKVRVHRARQQLRKILAQREE